MTANVYTKLQSARVQLQKKNLKKSGKNTFAGYEYYELQDYLPEINELFAEIGLFGAVTFTSELATLTIINCEKPEEQIVFTSPMAEANLKGCHPIQNAGAVQSYQRRYLWQTALEIVEHDALDGTTGKEQSKPASTPSTNSGNPASEKQLKMIDAKAAAVARKHSTTKDAIIKKFGIETTSNLNSKQAAAMIEKLIELEK